MDHESRPPPQNIGSHCSYPPCSLLDFLPIKCPYCSLPFCSPHSKPFDHACPRDPNLLRGPVTVEERTADGERVDVARPFLPDRDREKVEEYEIRRKEEGEKDERKRKARELLAKNFGKTAIGGSGSSSSQAAKKSKPPNPKIELMRLRNKAKPGDPRKPPGDVAMSDRVHLKACWREEVKELWFDRKTGLGKVLDLLANGFGVVNRNNEIIGDDERLSLAIQTLDGTGSQVFESLKPLSMTLNEAINNSKLVDGEEIRLVRGATDVA